MRRAIYAGSFDPVTLGHVDLIERGARLVDELVVCVAVNPSKSPLLSVADRVALLEDVTSAIDSVRVTSHEGLIVDFARAVGATVLLRGLRDGGDFRDEMPMALTNRELAAGLETVFLCADPRYSFISSRLIKEVLHGGGNIRAFVPEAVAERLEGRG